MKINSISPFPWPPIFWNIWYFLESAKVKVLPKMPHVPIWFSDQIWCSWILTGEQKGNDLNQKQAWRKIVLSVWLFSLFLDGSRKNKYNPCVDFGSWFFPLSFSVWLPRGRWREFSGSKRRRKASEKLFALINLTLFHSWVSYQVTQQWDHC